MMAFFLVEIVIKMCYDINYYSNKIVHVLLFLNKHKALCFLYKFSIHVHTFKKTNKFAM